jgi:hypothetical protein
MSDTLLGFLPNVTSFGADSGGSTDSKSAFQAAVASTTCSVAVDPGTYKMSGKVEGKYVLTGPVVFTGSGGIGIGSKSSLGFSFVQTQTTSTDYSSLQLSRSTSHTGGSAGYVNSGMRLDITVGPSVTNYEWGVTSVLNNSAVGGQNVALYGQGNRVTSSTGPTWAGVMEVREEVAINNPTSGLVGLEVDNRSNGTDTGQSRIGVDVVVSRYNTSGPDTTCSFGVRVQNGGDSGAAVDRAFQVAANNCNVGFDTTQATINEGAIRMSAGQAILFDAAGTLQLKEVSGEFAFEGGPISIGRLATFGQIATTASAGGGTLPSGTVGFLEITIDGNPYKIPFYGN